MASVAKACKAAGGLGARLGLHASSAELQASLRPQDYVYGQPTAQQLQRLLKQQVGEAPPAGGQTAPVEPRPMGFGPSPALQGATAPAPAKPLPAPADDPFHPHLDLDDDCLRILLGEDEDESGPCGSASGAASGASEKSCATADGGAPVGDREAASHDDDDIAMLFGELRGAAGASLEPLDLHLLGTAPLAATDDSDTASAAGDESEVLAAAANAGVGLKRCRPAGGAATPASGRGLMLSMNYEKAAESINLELLASGRKVPPSGIEGVEAALPLLSPLLDFGFDFPGSPHSLASGSDVLDSLPSTNMRLQLDSASKRKRAVH